MPAMLPIIAVMEGGQWRPGIGDPTIIGWVTVVAYALAAGLCYLAWRGERRLLPAPAGLRPGLWWALLLLMLALGVNKQLDLQSLLTVAARRLAVEQGWYAQRRELQRMFIMAIAAAGALSLALAAWWVRAGFRRYILALAGTAILGCFILIRATSFHDVDPLISRKLVGGVRANAMFFELTGIMIIAIAAARARLSCSRRDSTAPDPDKPGGPPP
jgi:hypothetical protein